MYEWTVQETVFVNCLTEEAKSGLFTNADRTKAVVVRVPAWDSIGTTYFNEEKWYAGYGQSQLRDMLTRARDVGGDVIFHSQILADVPELQFVVAPKPGSVPGIHDNPDLVKMGHPDTVWGGKWWCEICQEWFPNRKHEATR